MSEKTKRTALVTGASAGLGVEFARLLARDGHDLVLVARRKERLDAIAHELKTDHGVGASVIVADLADSEAPVRVVRNLEERGVAIDVLINNAGIGTFGQFVESDVQKQLEMIQVNVTALTHLTRRLLPGMVNRGFGQVMNVASTAAFQPGPLTAVYYACKAYVLLFSEAIGNELRGTGVSVTACCPGPTATEFHSTGKMDISRAHRLKLVMDAPRVAQIGYRAMCKGKPVVIPGLGNWLVAESVRFTPRRAVTRIVGGLQSLIVNREGAQP